MNSRQKGKRGELELAEVLREHGFNSHRGQQYKGGEESPDVTGIDGVHIECKRNEHLDIYGAVCQAVRDCGKDTPVVMHRKNRQPWLVTMRLEDFINLYKEAQHGTDNH